MKTAKKYTVEEILEAFKTPRTRPGRCALMKQIDTLPENIQAALLIAIANKDVTNKEIFNFIMGETDLIVNLNKIQVHRHKKGCAICLYGGPK
jgi:hypothetical protein